MTSTEMSFFNKLSEIIVLLKSIDESNKRIEYILSTRLKEKDKFIGNYTGNIE